MLHPALPPPRHQSRLLQHAEVLGDGGQRDVEGRGQIAHARPAAREAGEDGAAGPARERGEDGVERGGLTLNHLVKRR